VREALSPAEVVLESGSEQGGKALLLSSSSSSLSATITYSCMGSATLTDVVVITSWPSIEGTKPVVLKCIDETTGSMVTNKEVDLSSLLGNKESIDQQASTTLHGMLFSEVKMASSSPNNDVIDANNKRFYSLSASARVSIGSSSSSSSSSLIADKDDKEEDDIEENEGEKRKRHSHPHQRYHQRNWKDRKNREEVDREDVAVKTEMEESSHQTTSSSTRSLQASTTTTSTTTTTTNSTGKERYTNPNCGQEGYPPCETFEEEQQDAVFQLMEGRVALIIATLGTVAIAYASQKYARED